MSNLDSKGQPWPEITPMDRVIHAQEYLDYSWCPHTGREEIGARVFNWSIDGGEFVATVEMRVQFKPLPEGDNRRD